MPLIILKDSIFFSYQQTTIFFFQNFIKSHFFGIFFVILVLIKFTFIMKRNILLFCLLSIFTFVSCSSDDSSGLNEEIKPTSTDWVPNKINIVNGSSTLFSEDYPHAIGCNKDYIRIENSNSVVLFEHEQGTCTVIETVQPWNRSGNQVTLVIFDITVSGTIISETDKQFVIESDVSQYKAIIAILYPQFLEYIELLDGLKVQLILDKK